MASGDVATAPSAVPLFVASSRRGMDLVSSAAAAVWLLMRVRKIESHERVPSFQRPQASVFYDLAYEGTLEVGLINLLAPA
jgi:hypothetical protein